ncbi:hypothetical protein KKG31_04875 [Patescibacteria group bacterium]|nr:hypothetical protein [Patescibacteria group bacterium]MBU1758459.1 hypothetical protein [Patescibacteria group bacterium]
MARLRAKYSNDEDIATKLGTTITALNTIKSARLQAVFGYLVEILQDEKDMLEL